MQTYSRALNAFAWVTAVSTLVLIVIGGLVTSHGAGMAVPDWPNTYGYNMFVFPVSQWMGGILYEHSHRLMGAWVGLLTTILGIWIWARETRGGIRWLGIGCFVMVVVLLGVRQMAVYYALACLALGMIAFGMVRARSTPAGLRWWAVVAMAAVVLQGVLGGLRVVWLKDQIGIFHATLAQLFFVLTCLLAIWTSRGWARLETEDTPPAVGGSVAQLFVLTTLLVLAQLIIGATMRHQHAGLAIPDFPLAHGQLWPDTSAAAIEKYNQQRLEVTAAKPITAFQIYMQMAHRVMAVGIFGMVLACALRARRLLGRRHLLTRLGWAWFGLIVVQVGLGAWTIWSNKAADIATLHVLVGALTLALGAVTCILVFRKLRIAIRGLQFSNNSLTHPGALGQQA